MDISSETDTTYYNIKDTKGGTDNYPQLGEHTPNTYDDLNLENDETADYLSLGDRASNTFASLDIGHQNGDQTQAKSDPNRSCYRKKIYFGSLIAAILLLLIGTIVAIFILIENNTVKVNGGWSPWNDWETCPVTCGDGTITRTRSCDNPPPEYGGDDCQGDSEQSNSCNEQHCPINGEWSVWANLGTCSLTCGGGMMTRSRLCNNPTPNYGGMDCRGDSEQSQSCNDQQCPINGGWSLWTSWSFCSLTCGFTKTRTRSCNNPPASNGGTQCSGQSSDEQACDGPCFSASNYYISSFKTSWNNAKSACTSLTKQLVRINSQDEQSFLQGLTGVSTMNHWIGMSCSFGVCTWEDGTPASNGWTKWAPGEPKDRACVWVGYLGNSWDDDYCDEVRYYICEN